MDIRDILRIIFAMLSLYFYSIAFLDIKKSKKATKPGKLVTDKLIKKYSRAIWLIIIGGIFHLIAILLLYKVI